jgi:hypothetical protein
MKKVTVSLLPLIILCVSLSCSRKQADPCQSDIEITTKQGCHDSVLGLPLTVTGYSQAEGWLWMVYAAEDTTSANLINLKIHMPSSDRLYVHDSILNRYPMIIVQAKTNCGDSVKESMYYSFVKRESANCTIWARRSL